jgi:hypothetical protein
MTLSQSIDDCSDTRHSCWFIARNAGTRGGRYPALDTWSLATSILPLTVQFATSSLCAHQKVAANRLPLPLRANLIQPSAAVKSP